MENEKLVWHNEQIRWVDMIPYEKNARKIKAQTDRKLDESLEEFGMAVPPTLDFDNVIIGGHQRQRLMLRKNLGDELTDVTKPNRKLTEAEFKKLNLILNSKDYQGEFDTEMLNKYFSEFDLANDFGIDMPDFEKQLSEMEGNSNEPELPIVSKFSEKYTAFVIVCTNEIDENFIAERLGLGKMKCYKSSSVGPTHVISSKQFIDVWNLKS